MCLLWACACNFTIREISPFSFQELVISCSPWCLSVVLQVLWHCSKLLSSFFPQLPQASKYASSLSVLWVRWDKNQSLWQFPPKAEMLDIHSAFLLPSQGRSCELGIFSWLHRAVLAQRKGYWDEMQWLFLPISLRLLLALCSPGMLTGGPAASSLVSGVVIKSFGTIYC